MGGERDRGADARDGAGVPAADPAAAAKAQKKAEKQRRAEERRRRWARPDPAAVEVTSGDGSDAPGGDTAVLTRSEPDDTSPPPDGSVDEVASGTSAVKKKTTKKQKAKKDEKESTGKGEHPGPEEPGDEPRVTSATERGPSDDVAPTTAAPVVPARGPVALWLLLLAAHPRQAIVTAAALASAAALAGRPPEQVGLLAAMALVGQAMLGWHNDLVDRDRDAAVLARNRDSEQPRRLSRKPLAEGRLEPGSVWYAFAVAGLVLVPVSVSNGVTAGVTYLVVVAIGMVANISLRHGWFSAVPWAASFALYPAVLSYAGPIGGPEGLAPNPALVGLSAALGVVVHLLRSLPGLVDDHRDGLKHLPLRLALKVGAPRLLALGSVLATGLVIALVTVAAQQGLVQY